MIQGGFTGLVFVGGCGMEKETRKTPRLCTYSETSTLAFVWIGTLTLMTFLASALLETRCQRSVPTVFLSETGDKALGLSLGVFPKEYVVLENRFLHFHIDKDSIIG